MEINVAREVLKKRISSDLFIHSLNVEKTAFDLAALYGVDKEKASLAGLLHDYGKIFPHNVLSQIALENDIGDEIILQEPVLLHGPVGAWLLEHELGIADKEVLEAVRVHTTGHPEMSLLSKIVYLADYIEPRRECPGVRDIRKIALYDLDRALLFAVNITIRYVLEREKIIHPYSIFFRNSLILSLRINNQELQNNEAN